MPETARPNGPLRLLYLTASAVEEGTPAYTHVTGIVDGLVRLGWAVDLRSPRAIPLDGFGAQLRRLLDVLWIQASCLWTLKSYDALYCRWHFALAPTAWCARLRRIPVVQEINGPYGDFFTVHPYMSWARRPAIALLRSQLRSADALVAVTELMKSWIQSEVNAPRIHVVPNGADTRMFSPRAVSRFSIGCPYAVFVGSLAPWQGIETMIAALDSVEWPGEVRLVIAGDGACRDVIESASDRHQRLIYLGRIPYEAVPGLVAGSTVGLIPKIPVGGLDQTGFSALKLYETLACGVPVIASDTPGHRETILDNECGLLIPVGDGSALARAVRRVIENPDEARCMGERGHAFAVREASWDSRARCVGGVLSQLVGTK